jgi:glycosyltransferase involved in cell wall biosynthesis
MDRSSLHAEPRVAVVHDYFTQRGGTERVAERLARLVGGGQVFAAVADPDALPPTLTGGAVTTTALQRVRRAGAPLQALGPVLPAAFGTLDLGRADVVLSSSSAFAHHVRPRAPAVHVCYCHTPPRFLWEPAEYFRERPGLGRLAGPPLALLRGWDRSAAQRVRLYVANSAFTAERIRRTYGLPAAVVHPPIETGTFAPSTERSNRFLVVARLRRHKRIDLAISAANRSGLPLDVIGEGSDLERLRGLAGPTVRFLGRLADAQVAAAMARCAGLLVPGIEDFGMATAEVQAAGRPPIALAAGGATEIVRDGETGFLVADPTEEALAEAMLRSLRRPLAPAELVRSAARFDAGRFDAAIREVVAEAFAARARETAIGAGAAIHDPAR